MFRKIVTIYGEELLGSRPNPRRREQFFGSPRIFIHRISENSSKLPAVPPSANWGRAIQWKGTD